MADELVVRGEEEEEPQPPSGWRRTAKDLGVLLVGGTALWVGVGWWRAPTLPENAPAFSLPTLAGGHVALADQRGSTVVLNFFATWCGPCELELPTLLSFASDHPEIPVYFLAVDGTAETLERYATAHAMPLDHVVRVDEHTKKLYNPETLPTTVVVDKNGNVAGAHSGVIVRPQLWWMTLTWGSD